MTARAPKAIQPPGPADHPDDRAAGIATAQKLIDTDPERARWSLRLALEQMADWPWPNKQRGGLSHQQYARTLAFAETLIAHVGSARHV